MLYKYFEAINRKVNRYIVQNAKIIDTVTDTTLTIPEQLQTNPNNIIVFYNYILDTYELRIIKDGKKLLTTMNLQQTMLYPANYKNKHLIINIDSVNAKLVYTCITVNKYICIIKHLGNSFMFTNQYLFTIPILYVWQSNNIHYCDYITGTNICSFPDRYAIGKITKEIILTFNILRKLVIVLLPFTNICILQYNMQNYDKAKLLQYTKI